MTFLFQAKSLGLLDPPAKGQGRGVVRGRGRGTPLRSRPFPRMARVWTRESASLDHRPKQITVDEIMLEQKEDTAEHFRVSNKCNYHNKCLGDHYITFRMCSGLDPLFRLIRLAVVLLESYWKKWDFGWFDHLSSIQLASWLNWLIVHVCPTLLLHTPLHLFSPPWDGLHPN